MRSTHHLVCLCKDLLHDIQSDPGMDRIHLFLRARFFISGQPRNVMLDQHRTIQAQGMFGYSCISVE